MPLIGIPNCVESSRNHKLAPELRKRLDSQRHKQRRMSHRAIRSIVQTRRERMKDRIADDRKQLFRPASLQEDHNQRSICRSRFHRRDRATADKTKDRRRAKVQRDKRFQNPSGPFENAIVSVTIQRLQQSESGRNSSAIVVAFVTIL